jgi:hypothetical protein
VPRPLRALPAVVTAAALLSAATTVPPVAAAAVGAAQPAAAGVQAQDPLQISIAELSPSVIPKRGVITVAGRVTNLSEETWTDLRVYPFASEEPIGGEAELAKAAESPADAVVGRRILTEGAYDDIPDLAPGESATYRIRLKRGVLGQTIVGIPGVYWFGVHVIKDGDVVAAGRARTFLPLVPPRTQKSVKTVLVVPLRRPIEYDAEGRLADIEAWSKNFAANGRLRQIIDLAESAPDFPVSWLVDPALLDAVERLADGNPERDLSPNLPPPGEEPGETEEPTPSEGADEGSDEESSKALQDLGTAAEAFLTKATAILKDGDVLALPYGDIDVAAAVSRDPELLTEARKIATESFVAREIAAQPAVAPVTGFLSAGGITAQEAATSILVSDQMLRGSHDSDTPTTLLASGRRVVLSDSGTSSGGPGPESGSGALAMRQRILADAATRVLSDSIQPLVVSLPAHWRPGPTWSSFSQGLDDVPWLSLEPLSNAEATPPTRIAASRLVYPDNHFDRELRTPSFDSARELVAAGNTLDRVLTRNDLVGGEITRQALTSLGYGARADTLSARQAAERATGWIDSQLGKVVVEAPVSVTMSSEKGRFSANLVNNLDQPVTVRVEAHTDSPGTMEIKGPRSIELDAGAQRTVPLDATSTKVGVHTVQLVVTDVEGTRLGSSDEMPIRAGQLGKTIWMILAGGGVLLFGAIAIRLVRRFRRTA